MQINDLTNVEGIPRKPRKLAPHGVDMIVLHFGARSVPATISTFQNRKVGTHYLVDADGTVSCLVDPALATWHCPSVNHRSIGIDLIDVTRGELDVRIRGAVRHTSPGTKEQLRATVELLRYLGDEWSIPLTWQSPLDHHRERADVLTPPFEPGMYAHGAIQQNRWDGWTLEYGFMHHFGLGYKCWFASPIPA